MGLRPNEKEDEFRRYAYRDLATVDDPKTFNPIAWGATPDLRSQRSIFTH
jgi:hypothetical protein